MLYKIALTFLPGISPESIGSLLSADLSLEDFMSMKDDDLEQCEVAQELKAPFTVRCQALERARKELDFINEHNIRVCALTDSTYPLLLHSIPDPPMVLYIAGNGDLNAAHMLAIVGTRRCTQYGVNVCNEIVSELATHVGTPTIVSGLAFGIDSAAHSAALANKVPTIGVVAHGLDMIYPAQNRDLANSMIAEGGAVVSEFPSGTKPFRGHFLQRNRIVAGLCHSTIVVESEVKGGAMNTANYAFNYSRDLYAVPGRISDRASTGCNSLIQTQKAKIFLSPLALARDLNWINKTKNQKVSTPSLFPELPPDSQAVVNFIEGSAAPVSLDEIHQNTSIPTSRLAGIVGELEFDGVILKLPGARYQLS